MSDLGKRLDTKTHTIYAPIQDPTKLEEDKLAKLKVSVISTGAMQTRFSISEEVTIQGGSDTTAKVLLSRLLNAKNINLQSEELISGIAYVVTYLDSLGMVYLGATIEERMLKLLEEGTADEAYP